MTTTTLWIGSRIHSAHAHVQTISRFGLYTLWSHIANTYTIHKRTHTRTYTWKRRLEEMSVLCFFFFSFFLKYQIQSWLKHVLFTHFIGTHTQCSMFNCSCSNWTIHFISLDLYNYFSFSSGSLKLKHKYHIGILFFFVRSLVLLYMNPIEWETKKMVKTDFAHAVNFNWFELMCVVVCMCVSV